MQNIKQKVRMFRNSKLGFAHFPPGYRGLLPLPVGMVF